MCGICGCFHHQTDHPLSRNWIEGMVKTLEHRGPDDRDVHLVDQCGLGHTRLSIIDLKGGRQPLFNEDRSIALVCNGEIYNYRELREELIGEGHRFTTDSDCEVIVHLWEDRGTECLDSLRGMFSFALYDGNSKTLFGARDRFGQKPFFYHLRDGAISFASEIKALLSLPFVSRELDEIALDQFLFYQFVPHPRTMFRGISQLPPAHFILAEKGEVRVERYWSWQLEPDELISEEEHLRRVRDAVQDAVESHLVSDVEVGVFLSGGIDSSLIAALAARHGNRKLSTFSISFPEKQYDESPFARMASEHIGTEHHDFPFAPGDVIQQLESMAARFDQPLADRAAMPLMMLSEHTAQKVKVVLTGDGGDELFGGYERHRKTRRSVGLMRGACRLWPGLFSPSELARCAADPLRLRKLRSRLAYKHIPEQESSYFKGYWEGWNRHRLYTPEFAERLGGAFTGLEQRVSPGDLPGDSLNRALLIDSLGYLPDDLLLKTDYSTMAHSLEARAPLLDHRLAEIAAKLPLDLKATKTETKVALRKIAADLLPPELVTRGKRGFAVPMKNWLKTDLREWVRDRLIDSASGTKQLFRPDAIDAILNEHNSGRRNHTSRIYSLLFFELWHRHYLQ